MIIRNFGVRHGRRTLAAPISRSCLRTLSNSTTTTTTTTTVAEPPAPPGRFSNPAALWKAATDAARKAQLADIPVNYREYVHQREYTKSVGSIVKKRYHPDYAIDNPPHDATLEMLMAAQVHMGHHVSRWNPANSRYIYGVRAGIHIISLETTAAHLRRAARVVEEVAYRGGLILFVGTRRGHMPIVVRAAELAKACHLYHKWTPGSITNRDVILASGQLQIVDPKDKPWSGFDEHLRDRRPVVPDLVVCLNPIENYTMLHECALENIPTIGVIDTDADPTWVTYQIPANDDSLRSVTLIAGVLGRAGERGQKRRLAAAEDGVVTWQTPAEIDKYITVNARIKAMESMAKLEEAKATGTVRKTLTREELMTDDELLDEISEPLPVPDRDEL